MGATQGANAAASNNHPGSEWASQHNRNNAKTHGHPSPQKRQAVPIPADVPQALLEKDKFNLSLYKTELCRTWEESKECKFGTGCLFAHGKAELRQVPRHPKYKTEICRAYHTVGTCAYGARCRFIHDFNEARTSWAPEWQHWQAELEDQESINEQHKNSQEQSISISNPISNSNVNVDVVLDSITFDEPVEPIELLTPVLQVKPEIPIEESEQIRAVAEILKALKTSPPTQRKGHRRVPSVEEQIAETPVEQFALEGEKRRLTVFSTLCCE